MWRRFFPRGLSTIIISGVLSLGTKRPPFSRLFIVFSLLCRHLSITVSLDTSIEMLLAVFILYIYSATFSIFVMKGIRKGEALSLLSKWSYCPTRLFFFALLVRSDTVERLVIFQLINRHEMSIFVCQCIWWPGLQSMTATLEYLDPHPGIVDRWIHSL